MRAFELHFAVIARWQCASFVDDVHQNLGAVSWQTLARNRVGLQNFLASAGCGHESFAVFDLDAAGAANRDRLNVLGAHHGANARAAGRAMQVVDDAGVHDFLFASDADGCDVHHRILMLLLQPSIRVPDAGAPDRGSVLDLAFAVDDRDIDRLGALAFQDDHIPAGELEFSAEVAAGVRTGDSVGERSFGDDRIAPAR